MKSALQAASDSATRARDAQTTRSLRTRLLCTIRCMVSARASLLLLLLLTAGDPPSAPAWSPFQGGAETLRTRCRPSVHTTSTGLRALKGESWEEGIGRTCDRLLQTERAGDSRVTKNNEERTKLRRFKVLKRWIDPSRRPTQTSCLRSLHFQAREKPCESRASTVASFFFFSPFFFVVDFFLATR